jgi:hypothetical protein
MEVHLPLAGWRIGPSGLEVGGGAPAVRWRLEDRSAFAPLEVGGNCNPVGCQLSVDCWRIGFVQQPLAQFPFPESSPTACPATAGLRSRRGTFGEPGSIGQRAWGGAPAVRLRLEDRSAFAPLEACLPPAGLRQDRLGACSYREARKCPSPIHEEAVSSLQ